MQLNRTSVFLPPVIVGCLFAMTLAGVDRLAFRDVSHFYTPLYDYVAFRCDHDWLPLWNPLDQTGCPLVGETTTAVLYPIRWLCFSLPIDSETAMAWYVALHLVLASYAAMCCARCCGVSKQSAIIAAVIYPLGGGVFHLFTNPPYLVGAAWLPLVLGPMLSRLRIPTARRIVVSGCALAMMVLGGDPQTALHAMLIATLIGAVRIVTHRCCDRGGLLCTLIAVPILAALLAAPQIAASISWGRQSDRVVAQEADRWLDPPLKGSRRQQAFQFSLPPWHLAEMITPNAFGSPLPINRRLSAGIPGDGRMWTPTIYLGMLTAIALLTRICQLRLRTIDAWTVVAVISLLLCLGHFGVVWLLQNLTGMLTAKDSAIGGLYWCLYHFLPGYDTFRYPAKWLPIFSLACAMLTAIWLDRGLHRNQALSRRVSVTLLLAVVAASLAVFVMRRFPDLLLPTQPQNLLRDPFWGPLDVAGGLAQIQRSLIHSAIALVAILFIFRLAERRFCKRPIFVLCLTGLAALDLSLSSAKLIVRVPKERERAVVASAVDRQSTPVDSGRWMRTQSAGGWPEVWLESADPHRLIDVEASGRAVWFGRWHLAERQAVFNNMTSIRSQRMAMFWKTTAQITDGMTADQRDQSWRSIRNWLAIGGVVHTTAGSIEFAEDERIAILADIRRSYRLAPAIQFFDSWDQVTADDRSASQWETLLLQISQSPELHRPRVHGDHESALRRDHRPGHETQPLLSIVAKEPESEWIELTTENPGLLTRAILQDGNWIAEITTADRSDWTPICVHSVDFLKQGVVVPAGHWMIRFRYAPAWILPSIAIAIAAWASLLAMLGVRFSIFARVRAFMQRM
jgi:hypothetical protein